MSIEKELEEKFLNTQIEEQNPNLISDLSRSSMPDEIHVDFFKCYICLLKLKDDEAEIVTCPSQHKFDLSCYVRYAIINEQENGTKVKRAFCRNEFSFEEYQKI